MAAYKASMCLATSNNYVLPGAASNDFIVYTGNAAQSTLFGVSNVGVFMRVDGTGNVAFAGNVGFSNQVALSGIQLTQRTSTTTNNVTSAISAVNGFSKSAGNINIFMDNGSNYIALSRSNVELARINSNGWLGVGTQTAQSVLHVVAPGVPVIIDGSNSHTYIALSNSSNGSAQIGLTNGVSQYSTSAGSNDLVIRNNFTNGRIHLQNGGAAAAITINSNNYVGIGNSNPTYPLDITGGLRTTSNIVSPFLGLGSFSVGPRLMVQIQNVPGNIFNTSHILAVAPTIGWGRIGVFYQYIPQPSTSTYTGAQFFMEVFSVSSTSFGMSNVLGPIGGANYIQGISASGSNVYMNTQYANSAWITSWLLEWF